jgi:hypothetical protein
VKIRFVHIVYDKNSPSEVVEKMVNVKDAVDERDVYTPPCVVRIRDLKKGAGQKFESCETGSGDSGDCCTGNHPSLGCFTGNGDIHAH